MSVLRSQIRSVMQSQWTHLPGFENSRRSWQSRGSVPSPPVCKSSLALSGQCLARISSAIAECGSIQLIRMCCLFQAEEASARAKEKEREQAAAVPVSAPADDSAAPNMSSGEGTPGPGRGQGPPGRGHSQPGRGPAPPGSSGRGQQEQPSSSGQGPPAGAGRGQGPSSEPANGRMPPPPGMDGGRGPGRGGRRGRVGAPLPQEAFAITTSQNDAFGNSDSSIGPSTRIRRTPTCSPRACSSKGLPATSILNANLCIEKQEEGPCSRWVAEQGREGGRGRFEYGRGRGPAPGVEPYAQQAQQRRPPPPQQLVTRHSDGSDTSGFQEAVDRRSRGRSRGWETHTPSSAPKKQGEEARTSPPATFEFKRPTLQLFPVASTALSPSNKGHLGAEMLASSQGGEPHGEGDKVSKVINIFDVLTTED